MLCSSRMWTVVLKTADWSKYVPSRAFEPDYHLLKEEEEERRKTKTEERRKKREEGREKREEGRGKREERKVITCHEAVHMEEGHDHQGLVLSS